MTNRQFNFSFAVGIAFIALGGAILGVDAVGFSLLALGAAIASLATLHRTLQGRKALTLSAADRPRRPADSAVDY